MNIIGEGFPKEIHQQVIQRQKVYGSGYTKGTLRSPEEILYLNANTSWCKLVSSVDVIDKSILQNASLSKVPGIDGNNLAKQFVLFNGTFNTDEGDQKSGIDTTKSILGYNYAYGIGGTDFGLRPMMGIQSAEIKHANRGSIRQATVKIKAWNKIQFDIIDVLYLRLGFDILLEWGHTMWYDNKGELHTGSDIENSLAGEFLTGIGPITRTEIIQPTNLVELPKTVETKGNGSLTYDDFLKLIQQKRLSSNGNYDAMFAKVTNFHWSFLPDGSYDITLDLVSIGDVVESFKINALINGVSSTDSNITGSDISNLGDKSLITLFANKNSIGQWFYTLISKFSDVQTQQETNTASSLSPSATFGNPTSTISRRKFF